MIRFSQIVHHQAPHVGNGEPPAPELVRSWREYRFLTTWLLEAERERVWDAIYDSERWPEWWRGRRGGRAARRRRRGRDRPGRPLRLALAAAVPRPLRDHDDAGRAPRLLEGDAVGELAGIGPLAPVRAAGRRRDPAVTAVLYEWNVATTKAWMNLLAPIARPIFQWNHDWVMRNGGTGLAKLLGARLLASGLSPGPHTFRASWHSHS